MVFHKSRLLAVFSMALVVCLMVFMFTVPVSAATMDVDYTLLPCSITYGDFYTVLYEYVGADLLGFSDYAALSESILGEWMDEPLPSCYISEDLSILYASDPTVIRDYNNLAPSDKHVDQNAFRVKVAYNGNHSMICYKLKASSIPYSLLSSGEPISVFRELTVEGYDWPPEHNPNVPSSGSAGSAFGFLTSDMVYRVMDEIKTILPRVVPVLVSFIALRKGLDFLQWIMNRA